MSVETLSIGNELKDAFESTSKWIGNGINWLTDIEEFYRDRAAIETEYASKLKELTRKHFDKKAKNSSHLAVGDDPHITPGSLESASVVLWNEVLTQTEAIAAERVNFAHELSSKIGDNLVTLKTRSHRIAKHVETVNEYLDSEKKATEDEVNKAKKAYDALCQAVETARQKAERSASEKYLKKQHDKEVEMNVGKNDYLIKINIANRLKDKYYYQDVPELLDYFQELNESRVGLLNKVLKNASIIERNANDKVKDKLHLIDETIDQNNPTLDVVMFIKHNQKDWKEPQDFYFVPCSIWHDDESLVTKEPELTTLKKRLNASISTYSSAEEACMTYKQKLEEATANRKQDQSNLTLKFDGKLSDSLSLLSKFMKEDSARVKSEVEIEIIQNFAGDKDLSYVEQAKQKKSKFGFLRGSRKGPENGNDTQSIHTVKSANSHVTTHSGIFNLRRNRAQSNASSADADTIGKGRALYQYDASGDDETSVFAGETVDVVTEDDGSGWTKVLNSKGASGLVPTSYLEITRAVARTDTGSKKKGPSVAPKRGAKRVQYVEALYDYQADGEDEMSIRAGDRIVLVQDDTDASGWTEGELDGSRGMFPTSYVKKI